jgi:hypothetical protein
MQSREHKSKYILLGVALAAGLFVIVYFANWAANHAHTKIETELGAGTGDEESTSAKSSVIVAEPINIQDAADDTSPSMLAHVSEDVVPMFDPWFQEYLSTNKFRSDIEQVSFISFDDSLIARIQSGHQDTFRFQIDNYHDYDIVIDFVSEYGGGWVMSGHIGNKADTSELRLFVNDDGTKQGDLFVAGVGTFIVAPTDRLPVHAIYLRTATFYN